jgi:adenylate cyclase
MQEDNVNAVAQIRQADQQKFPLFQLVAAIVYQQAGMPDEAARASASFAKLGPQFLAHLNDEIEERISLPEDRHRFLASLQKAGLRTADGPGVALAGEPTVGQ